LKTPSRPTGLASADNPCGSIVVKPSTRDNFPRQDPAMHPPADAHRFGRKKHVLADGGGLTEHEVTGLALRVGQREDVVPIEKPALDPMPYRSADGRTFPGTSRGRHTALFFTNDHGVYIIDPSAGSASKIREAGTQAERDHALDLYRHDRQVLQNRRLEIPRRARRSAGTICGI
jgi:hypothetical protein